MKLYCEYCGADIYNDPDHECTVEALKSKIIQLNAEIDELYYERAGDSL